MRLPDEDAVSTVIGTILMLAVTVTAFGALAIVVTEDLGADEAMPRTSIELVGGEAVLLRHQGGEGLPLAQGRLVLLVDGERLTVPLTEFAGYTSDGATWRIGETLCVSCLPQLNQGQAVESVAVAHGRGLLLDQDLRRPPEAAPAPEGVDLVAEVLPMPPPLQQSEVTITVRITNKGTEATPDGVPVMARIVVAGEHLADEDVGPLGPGASADASATWVAQPGPHVLRAVADPADLIEETSVTNNVGERLLNVAASVFDPGFAYEDTDGDRMYTPGTDIPLDGVQLDDGIHDAGTNGLVVPPSVGPLSKAAIDLKAGLHLVVHVDLTGLGTGTNPIQLRADGAIDLADTSLTSPRGIIVASGSTLMADGANMQAGRDIQLNTKGDLHLEDANVHASLSPPPAGHATADVTSAVHTVFVQGASIQDSDNCLQLTPAGATIVGTPFSGGVC